MNEDKTLEKLKSLSEDELKALIGAVSDAMGKGEGEKKRAMAGAGFLKRKMNTLNGGELEALLGRLDPNTLAQISDAVKKLGGK